MSSLASPVVEPRDFPVGALVRLLQPRESLLRILRDPELPGGARLAAGDLPVARVVAAGRGGTLALKIDGAGGGRISNAYEPPCATRLELVDGELERLTLEACVRLTRAERERLRAIDAQQRLWASDRAGRRARGSAVAVAGRSSRRAFSELVALVQRPDVPPAVARRFALVGPTYYDAAAAVARSGRFAPAPTTIEGDPT